MELAKVQTRDRNLGAAGVAVAERFLRRGNVGLFGLSCEVGRELGHDLPPSDVAVVVGTSRPA